MRTSAGFSGTKSKSSSFSGNKQLSWVTSWLKTLKKGLVLSLLPRQWACLPWAVQASLMLIGEL